MVGERLAGSYANFYIANDAVIVPQFDQETWDSWAVATGHEWTHSYFVGPGRLVLSRTDDKEKDEENCERCRAALKLLESETDAKGRLAS
jgi:agmatine/peptidylarginine deiminase